MQLRLKHLFLLVITLTGLLAIENSYGQIVVTGTVYDSSRLYVVPDVEVTTSSGQKVITDSVGSYTITAQPNDSIRFFYNGKYTLPFVVDTIDPVGFDISLRVPVKNKYKLLKEVTVFSNSYRQDSLEHRERFEKLFGGKGGSLSTTYTPGGAAGIDIGELIGLFQFKKNKHRQAFQELLVEEEQERYVDYRFSPQVIERVTGLTGKNLEEYRENYRPSYYFVKNSTLLQFYDYLLQTSYRFKRNNLIE